MAQITITNVSAAPVQLPDIAKTLAVGESITFPYSTFSFPDLPDVISARNSGQVAVVVDYEVTEQGAEAEGDGPGAHLWDYATMPYDFHCAGPQPDRFCESNEKEVFALSVAEGVSVVKVQADHGGDVQAAINAAQAAGPGTIVWFDVAFDAEIGAQLTVADGNPIRIFGFSRDPSQTVLKRAVAHVYAAILRYSAGATMCGILSDPEQVLRKNRIVVRDITFNGQDGAAGLHGLHFNNTGAVSLKHVTVENCVMTGCKTYGINLEGLSSDTDPMQDFVYDNCLVYSNGSTGIKHDSGALSGLRIQDCKFYDHPVTGLYIRSVDLERLHMARCVLGYNGEYGALFESTNDIAGRSVIQDCVFHQNGWQIGPSNPCGLILYNNATSDGHRGLTIRRCLFYQNGEFQPFSAANGDDHGSGIKVKLKGVAQEVVIEDCDFKDNGHFGIHLHARGGSYAGSSQFTAITVRRCNFQRHMLAGIGADNLSGLACDCTAIGNFWNSTDGAADAPLDVGYTAPMYTGAGHGAAAGADACLSSTPMGYKKEVNEGEVRYPVTMTVTS